MYIRVASMKVDENISDFADMRSTPFGFYWTWGVGFDITRHFSFTFAWRYLFDPFMDEDPDGGSILLPQLLTNEAALDIAF